MHYQKYLFHSSSGCLTRITHNINESHFCQCDIMAKNSILKCYEDFLANTLYIHELQCCSFPKLIAKTQDQLENKPLSNDRLKVTIFHTRFSIIFTLLYWWPDAHPRQHTQITSLYMMTHFFANTLYIHELKCCLFPKLIAKTQDQLENKPLSNDRLKVTIFHTRFSIIFTLLYWWPDAHPRQHTQITSLYMMTHFFANTLYIHELQYCSFPKLIAKTQDQLENNLLSNDRLKVTIFDTRFSISFTLLYWWPDAHPRQHTQITFLYMMTLCEHTLYTQIAMLFILQTDSQNARPVGEQTTFERSTENHFLSHTILEYFHIVVLVA